MPDTFMRFTTVGNVDDGKSTLIGRLLHDNGAIFNDHLLAAKKASRNGLDFSLFTDGLRAEREQGITIDVAYRHFSTAKRRYILADTPGHEQYTANMVTGASTADAAVILLDVCNGVRDQTRRHAYLAWLLGIRTLCVVVNKMDKIGFDQKQFALAVQEVREFARRLPGCELHFIPVSALEGDNIVNSSARTDWYKGPTLIEFLDSVSLRNAAADQALRFPVQYVIRGAERQRFYAGQIATGSVKPGDEVSILPSGRKVCVESIMIGDQKLPAASAPMSVSLTFDDAVDLSRGHVVTSASSLPVSAARLEATIFWSGLSPLQLHHDYLLKHTTQELPCKITELLSVLNIDSLEYEPGNSVANNAIAQVRIRTQRPILCDPYNQNRATGSFILLDRASFETVAAGIITVAHSDAGLEHMRSTSERQGMVVWFTGLPSAGKTTIGQYVQKHLRNTGVRVELLDGDVLRQHLCKDLGFSRADREENIRRIGFVAEMLARNGIVVLVSAIAPYRAVREEMRKQAGNFIEVYVNAPLVVCEQRDVKGLYRRARQGELKQLTGIDDPYEPPIQPEVECLTAHETIEQSAVKVISMIESLLR